MRVPRCLSRNMPTLALIVQSFAAAKRCPAGHVTLDGTLGPSGAVAGPTYRLTPQLGKQSGPNLFFSFRDFSLDRGDVAEFSGPASTRNVLARVTGGSPSTIDGTLRCTIDKANFYLINPSGVVFGPGAALDVKGSFVVTTADAVRLGADGRFDAASPHDTILTTAAPAAFGF